MTTVRSVGQHKEAIEAAVKAAEDDGYVFDIRNPCSGCCSDYRATLYKSTRGDNGWEETDVRELDI